MNTLKKAIKELISSLAIKNCILKSFAIKTSELDPGDNTSLQEIKMFAEIMKAFQALSQKNAKDVQNEIQKIKNSKEYSNKSQKNEDLKKLTNSKKFHITLEKFSRKTKDKCKQIFREIQSTTKTNKDVNKLIEEYACIRNDYFGQLSSLTPKDSENQFGQLINETYENVKNKTWCDMDTHSIIGILNQTLKK